MATCEDEIWDNCFFQGFILSLFLGTSQKLWWLILVKHCNISWLYKKQQFQEFLKANKTFLKEFSNFTTNLQKHETFLLCHTFKKLKKFSKNRISCRQRVDKNVPISNLKKKIELEIKVSMHLKLTQWQISFLLTMRTYKFKIKNIQVGYLWL